MPALQPGDLIAVMSAGAYGAVQAGTYNTRPLVPEVLVREGEWALVRPRMEVEDLIALDRLPPWLRKPVCEFISIAAELIGGCLPFARWPRSYCVLEWQLRQIPSMGDGLDPTNRAQRLRRPPRGAVAMRCCPVRSAAHAGRSCGSGCGPRSRAIATAVGLFLAVSWLGLWLMLPPVGRAIGLGLFFLLTAAAFAPLLMVRLPSAARRPAPARSQQHAAAPAGDHDRRRSRGRHQRFVRRDALARPCRARAARGQDAAGRPALAAACRARSLRHPRARPGGGDCDLLHGRRRPHAAHRRGLRLAGRDGARPISASTPG